MTPVNLARMTAIVTAIGCGTGIAHAGEIASGWNKGLDFDLSRDIPERAYAAVPNSGDTADQSPSRIDWRTEINGLSAHEELGPRWRYRPMRAGPSIELAALGAGKKERPGLAHVAVDWRF